VAGEIERGRKGREEKGGREGGREERRKEQKGGEKEGLARCFKEVGGL